MRNKRAQRNTIIEKKRNRSWEGAHRDQKELVFFSSFSLLLLLYSPVSRCNAYFSRSFTFYFCNNHGSTKFRVVVCCCLLNDSMFLFRLNLNPKIKLMFLCTYEISWPVYHRYSSFLALPIKFIMKRPKKGTKLNGNTLLLKCYRNKLWQKIVFFSSFLHSI